MELSEQAARQNLSDLLNAYYKLVNSEQFEKASESDVLALIERLFRNVLGWPIDDMSRFRREARVAGGKRADRVLTLDNGENIYIEAKRFGALGRLSDDWALAPAQLSLPGMASDRTTEEQQAINYAFRNNDTWAILTNFQILRLFNAQRDWLVFSFEAPKAYEIDFDLLWQLSWQNLNRGSLQALNSQRWTRDVDTDYLQFINQQRELLAIDITQNRDRNGWAFATDGSLRVGLLRKVVQRFLDRLVVARFAEDHLVIPANTLQRLYDLRQANSAYTRELGFYLRDFFKHFDEQHNSALFARSEVDEAYFSDAVLLPLIKKLYEAKYRAMPADIMGNTYEQYLGKTLVADGDVVTTRDNLETRKKQGSYYTPQHIVQFIVDQTLGKFLYATHDGKPNGDPLPEGKRKTAQEIQDLRVLDSACGSGSFLIYAYQALADFYQSEIARLAAEHSSMVNGYAQRGGSIPFEAQVRAQAITNEHDYLRDNYRNLILERHLYGVDFDPQAAEIAVVNLVMRAMERQGKTARLPLLLNQNIKVGNSLIGLSPNDSRLREHASDLAAVRNLRQKLVSTSHLDPRHDEILDELATVSESLNQRFADEYAYLDANSRPTQPFHWVAEFPEVFVDEDGHPLENPGFHFVFGNPPYGARLSRGERSYHRREYELGTTNTAALFMAQSLRLLRNGGAHGFIVPKSFLYASNWRRLREKLLDGLETLVDCGRAWKEVLLEQVIYIHRKGAKTSHYRNLNRTGQGFDVLRDVDKLECHQFQFLVNGITAQELEIARVLTSSGVYLGQVTTNRRGAGLQASLTELERGKRTIGGANVQRYKLQDTKGYFVRGQEPPNAIVQPSGILAQNILTRLLNPLPHTRIVAHLTQADEQDCLVLDTVNQIQVTQSQASPSLIVALLNSKLINWYAYRFLLAKAALTMHFDRPITDRIPLPNIAPDNELAAEITVEVDKIYENRHANLVQSQQHIDELVFQLYELSDEQISHVNANMP